MSISPSEINFIRQSCMANFRLDGRSNSNYRPYTLLSPTQSPILSNGSSRLLLPSSNTDILCSIKAELVHPPFFKSEGIIEVNMNILPFASTSNSKDRKNIRKEEQEVSSLLSHLLLPHLLNKNDLVVLEGRYVWRLNIDILVTHCDGSLVDACSMVIWGAMQNLMLPNVVPVEKVQDANGNISTSGMNMNMSATTTSAGKKKVSDEIMLDSDIANSVTPRGVLDCPVVVTICLIPAVTVTTKDKGSKITPSNTNTNMRRVKKKHDSVMIVDASRMEESCASTKVSMSVDASGNICGVHKYGSSSVLGNGSANGDRDDGDSSSSLSSGNIKFDMLPKIQNMALSCSKLAFGILKASSCHEHNNDDGGAARTMNGNAIFSSTEDVYDNFFRGQFELQ